MDKSRKGPRVVVEHCDSVRVTDTTRCRELGLCFATLPTRGGGRRSCLICPGCGRRAFKLYRPVHLRAFACKACHDLSYTSVQKHDARLDRLLKVPEQELLRLVFQNENVRWCLLAIRAGYIRLGLMNKY